MSEFDDTLTRLFAERRETLPAVDFLESVAGRIRDARRQRAVRHAALMTAAAVLAIVLTPYVARGSLAVASHLAAWLPALGSALASPVGWVCSLASAAWALRRARGTS